MSHKTISWISILLFTTLVTGNTFGQSAPEEPCPQKGTAGEDGSDCIGNPPYRHPLLDLQPVNGKLPFVDTQNTPDGDRYVIFDSMVVADEDGTPVQASGVTTGSVRPITAEERRALDRENPVIIESVPPLFSAKLEEAILEAAPNETLDILLTLDRGEEMPLDVEIEHAIARGEVRTLEDYNTVRLDLLGQRAERIAAVQAPVIEAIEALGGKILNRCVNLSCLSAQLDAGLVHRLESENGVERVELDVAMGPNGAGVSTRAGHQITHVVADFDGEGPTYGAADTIWGSVIETCRPREPHYVFHDTSSTSSNRYFIYDCTTGTCDWQTITGTYCSHATGTAATVFGDTEDGQVAGVTGVSNAGMAPEANAYLYRVGNLSNMTAAWDHITTRANKVHAANMSISLENHPPYNCSGTDATSDLADELYENGTLLVMAAGNDGGGLNDCRVEIPGSALGVLTVGAHGSAANGCGYDENDIRTDDIHPASAWGGNSTMGDFTAQGRGRAIIDLTAYYYIGGRAGTTTNTSFGNCMTGTSFSAPVVTGAALDFVDFYKQTYSNFIDNPGSLFANMLIMGDRANPGGGKKTAGVSHRFGAGRLKMRRFDNAGLDGPSYYYNGSVCVGDGETVTLTLNGGQPFSQDFDDFKAVAWWYDPGFHAGQALDDVELYLRRTSGTLLRYSASPHRNKEMVKHTDIGGEAVKLEFVGDRVTADNVGCGNNSMRVFFTLYAEDGDREAHENLDDVERL